MLSALTCIRDDHDWRLILAAATVCLIGSFATMLLFGRVASGPADQRKRWIAASAVASGTSIWATHFIAMLAYAPGFPISYDVPMTLLSVAFAIAGSALAITLAAIGGRAWSFAAAGWVMTLGIAAMHFTGMEAIQAPADLSYKIPNVLQALAVGGVFGMCAFLSFRLPKKSWHIPAGAIFLLLSICAIHFIAMGAIVFVANPAKGMVEGWIDRNLLAGMVMAVSLGLILLAICALFLERHVTDLRGLADASFEGFLIVRDGQIIDTNNRFSDISGWSHAQVVGKTPEFFLPDADIVQAATSVETDLLAHDGRRIPVELFSKNLAYRGKACCVWVIRDLTERKRAQQMIEHLAHHDTLTDLPNRSLFHQRFRQALVTAERKKADVAVFYMDLDRFKAVNDIFGHAKGDAVLCQVAGILKRCVTDEDTVARLGGDEFAIIQPNLPQPAAARQLAERILKEFAAEMDVARDPMAVGVSLGIAIYGQDGLTAEQLSSNADTALYRAKQGGRGNACFFDQEMDQAVRTRRQLEADLRQAINRDQVFLYYQPILDARTDQINGYEAFLRWYHPTLGKLEPEIFIPIAEESGSIIQLGEWVLEQACLEAARWRHNLTVAVNISPVQFLLPTLYDQVEQILTRTGLAPERLELEITEAALVRDRATVLATLRRLHERGVRVVMDDFGTGYSSLSNLRAFPFDKIKVDRSFTGALEHDPAARSIVRAVIGLGHSLGIPVVTEGVETEEQKRIVVEEGCAQLQGIYLGKPDIRPSIKLAGRGRQPTPLKAVADGKR